MEFQEVMKQYNRMFEAHKKGVLIPVEASYETAVKQPEYFEEVVMSWAVEHPEPVYETWYEFLTERYHKAWEAIGCDSIPADIAQKLGLKPKEV